MSAMQVKPYDVFLSYSSDDIDKARLICEKLQDCDSNVYMDRNELQSGDDWGSKIRMGLMECKLVLVLVSRNIELPNPDEGSRGSWVWDELNTAYREGIEIVPYMIDYVDSCRKVLEHEFAPFVEGKELQNRLGGLQYRAYAKKDNGKPYNIKKCLNGLCDDLVAKTGARRVSKWDEYKALFRYVIDKQKLINNGVDKFELLIVYPFTHDKEKDDRIISDVRRIVKDNENSELRFSRYKIDAIDEESNNSKANIKTLNRELKKCSGVIVLDYASGVNYDKIRNWSKKHDNRLKPVLRVIDKEYFYSDSPLSIFQSSFMPVNLLQMMRLSVQRGAAQIVFTRRFKNIILSVCMLLSVMITVGAIKGVDEARIGELRELYDKQIRELGEQLFYAPFQKTKVTMWKQDGDSVRSLDGSMALPHKSISGSAITHSTYLIYWIAGNDSKEMKTYKFDDGKGVFYEKKFIVEPVESQKMMGKAKKSVHYRLVDKESKENKESKKDTLNVYFDNNTANSDNKKMLVAYAEKINGEDYCICIDYDYPNEICSVGGVIQPSKDCAEDVRDLLIEKVDSLLKKSKLKQRFAKNQPH